MTNPADFWLPEFFVVSTPSQISGDNSGKLTVTHDHQTSVLEFPGPNGKLESDICFRKLWSGDIRL